MPVQPGQTLLHYRIVEKIGEGGMGEVWKAVDTKLDREVALKLLPEAVANDSVRLGRFEREAKAVAALDHPNIVTVHAIEEDAGQRFITMELVRGRPLRHLLEREGLSLRRILDIALPLIGAVGKAHERGITHRDLKPDNIMVDDDGRVRVLDFGLAKMDGTLDEAGGPATVLPTETRTTDGTVLGTTHYMSPEQAQGKPADARSDVFSLGVILYEMASGSRPFGGETKISVLSSIIKDDPPSIVDVNPKFPRQYGRIVRRCLEKDPERRYQRARSLATELEHLADEVGSAGSASRATRRGKLGMLVASGALVLIAALSAMGFWRGRDTGGSPLPATHQASVAVLPFVNVGGGPENEYFSEGMTDELINALGRVDGLSVPARTTMFTLRDKGLTVREIGERLGVEHVLEGTVRKSGDQLRVSAQLIHAGDGFDVWTESYNGDFSDVFAIQEQIARAITENLRVRLVRDEGARLVPRSTSDLEAYNLQLQARFHQNKLSEQELLRSIELYRQAIELDPDYAEAWVGLAISESYLSSRFRPPREQMPKVRAAAQRALELDPTLGAAHSVMGRVHFFYDWDWERTRHALRRAIELSPRDPNAHLMYGSLLVSQGEFSEGVREANLAEELDPMSIPLKWEIWVALYMAGEFEQAVDVCNRGLELDAEHPMLLASRGATYTLLGDHEKALADLERSAEIDPEVQILEFLLYGYSLAGQPQKARAGLDELLSKVSERYTCPYEVATVYVGLEEYDTAMEWFDRAYEERADCWPWGRVDPRMKVMREDQRYEDLLRRVGHIVD